MKTSFFAWAIISIILLAAPAWAASGPAEGADLRISLVNQQPDPVAPGGQYDVRFKIENLGSSNAENVRVKIFDEYPIAVVGTNERPVGSIYSQQSGNVGVIAKFTLKAADGAADGTYDLKFAYSIDSGAWVVNEISGVNVKSEEAVVAIASVKLTPERLAQGSAGQISVSLKNYATSAMNNIRAELLTGASFSPVGSTTVRIIDRMESRESDTLTYSLMPKAEAASQVYPLTLLISYTDALGNSQRRNETIGVPVFSEPSYDINIEDSNAYTAGSTGDIVISISDTGASQIKYLVIELIPTNAYTLISANKVYVGNLESNDFQTASFKVHMNNNIGPSTILNARLTYKDDYNQPYEENVQLPLKVYSASEAKAYGLIPSQNMAVLLFSATIQILLLVFAIFMLIDLVKKPVPVYKKILWTIIILTLFGAAIYYFIGRKKAVKQ